MRKTVVAIGRPLKFIEGHEQFRCSQVAEAFKFVRFLEFDWQMLLERAPVTLLGKNAWLISWAIEKATRLAGRLAVREDRPLEVFDMGVGGRAGI